MAERRQVRPESDLQAFYQAVKPGFLRPSYDGEYTFEDRFRDFQAVFAGEAGRRVLSMILDFCEDEPLTIAQVERPGYLAWRAGKREVGMKIVQWMAAVPPDPRMGSEEEGDGEGY